MVTNTTIYTRQMYVSLSNDVPDVDFRNGDEVYLIDTRQRVIYDEENSTWYPIPTGGGGGTLITKTINANGSYAASADGADGFSSVTVAVPMPTNLTLLDSGTYTNAITNPISLSIPTNAHNMGVPVLCLVYVESKTPNTGQTLGATFGRQAACADFATADEHSWFPANASFSTNVVLIQNSVNTVTSSITGSTRNGYSGATGILTLARQGSNYPLLTGTYKWYVWGLPT